MKKLYSTLLIIASLLLPSCGSEPAEGYVVAKDHYASYISTFNTFIRVNNMLIPFTHVILHPETWTLDLDKDKDDKADHTVYLKDAELWESIQIGDYFCWNEEDCYVSEPGEEISGEEQTSDSSKDQKS